MPPARSRCLASAFLGLFCLLLFCLAVPPPPVRAAEVVLFGPSAYTRTAGPPNQFSETIVLPPTLTAPFRLHVQNGNSDGSQRVSSATITLNDTQVAGPSDFNQQVGGFDRTVILQASNTLQIRLTSKPGSGILLTLYGTIPPPTLARLEPPALPITQGGTGILTATLSAVQATDTLVSLGASPTSVLGLPSSVTVPAGSLTTTIPITALAVGTATITATLHGSSVSSTITVAPAGPTLTSLLPATLQVSQGASGILTVTLSAAQATHTVVPLTSSHTSLVSLPPAGAVTVPAGQTTQAFAVFGVGEGQATITASLNGTTAESQVAVVLPAPTVVSLLPPVLPLTEGSHGTLTLTLNASQPTDTAVRLTTSDPAVAGLPADPVTVPAHTLLAAVPVSGLTRGAATVTASLNDTTATAAVTVAPPPPTLGGLACPGSLTPGATALCTLTLNATQLTETVLPLGATPSAVLALPSPVTIPANTLSTQFAVTGLALGSALITAGPLNGTSQASSVTVLPPPPMLESLAPSPATLVVGASASLSLTLNAAQPTDTVIPLSASPSSVLGLPVSVTVPAGQPAGAVPLVGLAPGTVTLTAGPLNGTMAHSTVTVNQLPPTVSALTPGGLSLPAGTVGTLTVTIAPAQSEATVVPLASSEPSVEVPGSVPVPAGLATAAFPVLARSEGSATLTAGPLNGTSQSVTITVTPAELVTLTITPPAPSIHQGQTQPFTVTGTYTDATTQDLTGTATWTSSEESVATITSPGGLATGLHEGQAAMKATVRTLTATATLTVTPPVLDHLALSPLIPTRTVGETLQLQATGILTDGTTQDVTAQVTWTSSDPAVSAISSPGGLATALAPGTTTLTATHPNGLTASTTLTVLLAPPALTGFSPSAGPVGTLVILTGTNLQTATGVIFNGVSAAFVILSATQLAATVPAGATSGPLTVATPSGTVASLGNFTVLTPPRLTMTSPAEGATINADRVLVTGTATAATAEVGVVVNGVLAVVTGTQWAAEIPLTVGTNEITATATDAVGAQATARIVVTVLQSTPAPLSLQALPASGVTPLTVTWQLLNQTGRPLIQYEIDSMGTGSFGPPSSTIEGAQSTYSTAGVYFPVLRATDDQGTRYLATTVVSVLDRAALDGILQARWTGLKATLMAGDVPAALQHFLEHERPRYAVLFTVAENHLQALGAEMPPIQPVYFTETVAKYRLRRQQQVGGALVTITHYIYFSVDADGIWRIDSF